MNAKNVIILAHSIGGVYAFQVRDKVKNLKAFVGIEPTDREIILNPPQEKAYLKEIKMKLFLKSLFIKKYLIYFQKQKQRLFGKQ